VSVELGEELPTADGVKRGQATMWTDRLDMAATAQVTRCAKGIAASHRNMDQDTRAMVRIPSVQASI